MLQEKSVLDCATKVLQCLKDMEDVYKEKYAKLEKDIENHKEYIVRLERSLAVQQMLNKLEKGGIENIKNIEIKKDGIHLYDIEGEPIKMFLHTYNNPEKVEVSTLPVKKRVEGKRKNKGTTTFKTVKKLVQEEENPEHQEEHAKNIDNKLEEMARNIGLDISHKETVENIDADFVELYKTRTYKKLMTIIMGKRVKLIGKLDLDAYLKIVNNHIKRYEDLLHKKKIDQKKFTEVISSALSPLEQRLLFYGKYYDTVPDVDEIQRFKVSAMLHMNYPKRYVPFSYTELYSKFHVYNLALFPYKELVKRILTNPYNFPNVVYLKLDNENAEDKYSYYILESIKEGKRCWKLENRLYNFSKNIADYMRENCIQLFRKIYYHIFMNNTYREDYREKAVILQHDGVQLIKNIMTLSKNKMVCNTVRKLISTHNQIMVTTMDAFDFRSDDVTIRKQFNKEEDTSEEVLQSIKRLFDGISEEDSVKLLEEFSTI
jgi:hypothetical protein